MPSRGLFARSDHEFTGRARVQDEFLRLQRHGARRQLVRTSRVGQHLHSPDEPD